MPAGGARDAKLDIGLWIGFANPFGNVVNEFRRQFGGRLSAVSGRNETAVEEKVRALLGARLESCHDVSTVGRPKAQSVIRAFVQNLTEGLTRVFERDVGYHERKLKFRAAGGTLDDTTQVRTKGSLA